MNKIVKVDFTANRESSVRIKEAKFCQHKAIIVDEHERTVTCQACNAVLDSFDYLLQWAKGDRRTEMWRRHAEEELKHLRETMVKLKRDERNTRVRLKRLKASK